MSNYQHDFYQWTKEQAALLRTGQLTELDIVNLSEEIEAMGRSEKRALESRLTILLMHLLKWQYQSERRGKSWLFTISEQRRKIRKLLLENPSLQSELVVIIDSSYEEAVFKAAYETGINAAVFPKNNPWQFEQLIDTNFFPDFKED